MIFIILCWIIYELTIMFGFLCDFYSARWKVIFDLVVPFGGMLRWFSLWPAFLRDLAGEIKQSWGKLK